MARISGKIERNRSPESVAAAPGAPAMRQAGAAIVTDTWATFTRDYGGFRAKKNNNSNTIFCHREKSVSKKFQNFEEKNLDEISDFFFSMNIFRQHLEFSDFEFFFGNVRKNIFLEKAFSR